MGRCSLGGQSWNSMDLAAAQGATSAQGSVGNASAGSGPVAAMPTQQVWGGPANLVQAWGSSSGSNNGNNAANNSSGANNGHLAGGGSGVWPGAWPSAGSEMSGGDGQPAASQQSKSAMHHQNQNQNSHHHQQQQLKAEHQQHPQQHFTPSSMPALHGTNSSLLSGNSGNSTLTGGEADLIPSRQHQHHQTHSFDTAG